MKPADFSVNRPVTIIMAVLVVLMIGAVSLSGLNVDMFPEMSFPVAVVITSYQGSAPQEVENMISRPLEEVLGTVGNIKNISSMSSMGNSIVITEFETGTNMDFASLEMREKIDMVRGALPEGASDPMLLKMDLNMMPVLMLAVSGDRPVDELNGIAEDVIKPLIERQDGVASVEVTGGLTREIQVIVEPEKLAAHGLSITDVVQALQMQNMNLSAGLAARGGQEMALRVIGEYSEIAEIAASSLTTSSGAQLRLDDVARIEDGFEDSTGFSRSGEQPSVLLSIQKQSGSNTVSVVRDARSVLEELESQLPEDVVVLTVMDQAEYIELSIQNIYRNLLLGALLAMVVLFIFLRNLRSTLIIALAMPISVVTTFILIYFGGLTLNMMTLGGLALGIGMMVDSSIVVLENIFRFREKGSERMEAAKSGSGEVANAITASVLTTIAVFFPIVYVEGIASELFSELALTVSFALISSLLIALTLIPMLSSRLLKIDRIDNNNNHMGSESAEIKPKGWAYRLLRRTEKWFKALDVFYRVMLGWCLSHRIVTVVIIAVLFVGSLLLVPTIGAEFIPSMDQGMISVDIELPRGSGLEETDKIVAQVERAFERYENDIELIFSSIGSSGMDGMGGMGGGSSNRGTIYVDMAPLEERTNSTEEVIEGVRSQVIAIPGAEITVSAAEMGFSTGTSAPVEITLKGDDLEELNILSARIAELVRGISGTREVTTSLEEGQSEIQLVVDREKAIVYGLSASQIASTVRTAVEGQVATRYRTGSEEIDVRVRLSEEGKKEVTEIENLLVASPVGLMVPLGEVAEIRELQAPSTIQRSNQVRVVSITAQLEAGRDLAAVMAELEKSIEQNFILPPGYTLDYGGEFELMSDAFGDLLIALVMAVALVYMILAAQFESLLHPFVIMFSLPVTVIGVVLALFITGSTFSVVTFIGVIMLAGIVVNNAIVLVDYINQLRQQGLERDEAILTAGPIRLRPILMTALTTILAMVPLAFDTGEGAEMQASMAIAVIGGLTVSTFLTLLFVPVIYSLFDSLRRIGRRKKKAPVDAAG